MTTDQAMDSKLIEYTDWGVDRIYCDGESVYTFTYRDKPSSNLKEVIHLMVK